MEQVTRVKFLYNEKNDDLFAFFPDEISDSKGNLTSYSHVGQHSSCCIEYANESRLANLCEYKNLLKELKSIGYNLQIIN